MKVIMLYCIYTFLIDMKTRKISNRKSRCMSHTNQPNLQIVAKLELYYLNLSGEVDKWYLVSIIIYNLLSNKYQAKRSKK